MTSNHALAIFLALTFIAMGLAIAAILIGSWYWKTQAVMYSAAALSVTAAVSIGIYAIWSGL